MTCLFMLATQKAASAADTDTESCMPMIAVRAGFAENQLQPIPGRIGYAGDGEGVGRRGGTCLRQQLRGPRPHQHHSCSLSAPT